MSENIFIVGMGAATAVGRGAWASAAAVRAGVSGFTQHPSMADAVGTPIRVAMAPWIDAGVKGLDRLEALLVSAVGEALAPMPGLPRDAARWALALALPSARPGLPSDLGPQLVGRVGTRFQSVFGSAAVFGAGHAAGLLGIQAACSKIRQGALDACLVAGVDSWLDRETLEWLESCEQIHGAGRLNNAWGFIPGEAGGALLLMRESAMRALNLKPLACVVTVGSGFEPKHIKTNTVCIGEGLTQAFQGAFASLPAGAVVHDVYCDLNGEPYRADEYGFTALRTKQHFRSPSDFNAPADCWGDVSAAGGLLHVMLASVAAYKGYAKGRLALAWGSSEMGERAAALLAFGVGGA